MDRRMDTTKHTASRSVKIMAMLTKAKELASEYCLSTSAHGVSHIVSSTHTIKKVGWILILSGVLVGCSYHISVLILSYLEYNYYTSITLDPEKPLTVLFYTLLFNISLLSLFLRSGPCRD